MFPIPKFIDALTPQTVATNATNSCRIDRLGFNYAIINAAMPAATATNSSAKFGALKLMESDTTAVSDAVSVSGYIGTTNATAATTAGAVEFVIPAHNDTSNRQIVQMRVPLQARKRYLFVISQAAASHQTVQVSANLFRPNVLPDTAAEAGVAAAVDAG